MPRPSELLRYGLLSLPALFVASFLLVPAGVTFVISFWERKGFSLRPAFSFAAYEAFFSGIRLEVLQISLLLAVIVTLLGLLLAYPVSYFLAYRVGPRTSRTWLFLLSVPFVINPVIRNFARLHSRPDWPGEPDGSEPRPRRQANRLAAVQQFRRRARLGLVVHAVHDLPPLAVTGGHRPAPC